MSLLLDLKKGINKSSQYLLTNLKKITTYEKIDDKLLQELEEILIGADLGISVTSKLISEIKSKKYDKNISLEEIKKILADEIEKIIFSHEKELKFNFSSKPSVIVFVGVNGSGKTTTIAKLANILSKNNKILIAACDTFRAAATEQLLKWSLSLNIDCHTGEPNKDPASVAYEASKIAEKKEHDILLIDTAGRLANNIDLMNQLLKIKKVLTNSLKDSEIRIFLILDGSTGYNMINQFEVYNKHIGINGLIITKLDGTSKGGALVSVADKHHIPIHFIGIGEKINDLYSFKAKEFSLSLFDLKNKL